MLIYICMYRIAKVFVKVFVNMFVQMFIKMFVKVKARAWRHAPPHGGTPEPNALLTSLQKSSRNSSRMIFEPIQELFLQQYKFYKIYKSTNK